MIVDLKLEGKVLFVTMNDAEKLYLATRNLGYAAVIMANEINVYDIVNADTLVIESEAVITIIHCQVFKTEILNISLKTGTVKTKIFNASDAKKPKLNVLLLNNLISKMLF